MKKLTAKEEELMRIFWTEKQLFVKDLLDYYSDPKPHINTLSTIVRGLEEKGYLSHESFGGTYRYFPIITADEYKKVELTGVIDKYFNSSYLGVVSSLIEEEKLSVADLKCLINRVEREDF